MMPAKGQAISVFLPALPHFLQHWGLDPGVGGGGGLCPALHSGRLVLDYTAG